MNIDLKKFENPDSYAWKNQVLKESKNENALEYYSEIENLNIDLSKKNISHTFNTPYDTNKGNDWDVVSYHKITDSFQKNDPLIQSLEHGANHLFLEITSSKVNWNKIFENIVLKYIHVSIKFHKNEQINSFKRFLTHENEHLFSIEIDPINNDYLSFFRDTSVSFLINGFCCEQIGASSYQQLALVLNSAEQVLQEINNPKRIKFHIGLGSCFFVETSKTRALKWMWTHLLKENGFDAENTYILGSTGWKNKSLNDPNMNLLRQTTESISGVSGGISGLLIHPVNLLSQIKTNWFNIRMSLNISHILKEESFLSKVHDPFHGAYIVEMITEQIIINSWELFLVMQNNSLSENKKMIVERIEVIRSLKEQQFLSGEKELLGMNLFKIEPQSSNSWQNIPEYLGMKFLIYEKLLK